MVMAAWCESTMHNVLNAFDLYSTSYYHLVSNYFNPAALVVGHWYVLDLLR